MKTIAVIPLLVLGGMCGSCTFAAGDDFPETFMMDRSRGWRQISPEDDSKILRTTDGGKHWLDVSPPALKRTVKDLHAIHKHESGFACDSAALDPMDADRAWVSVLPVNGPGVLLEHTTDGGKHWRQRASSIRADGTHLCFVDELHGFLLATSLPAAGLMKKDVYVTADAGKTWRALPPPNARGCYANGISFRSRSEGWITATYHGGDQAPLYRTTDGGKSWKLQKLPIPADYVGGYAETFPPVFIGTRKKKGYLPVKLVRHEPQPGLMAWFNYETGDGGKSWHPPQYGIPSAPWD